MYENVAAVDVDEMMACVVIAAMMVSIPVIESIPDRMASSFHGPSDVPASQHFHFDSADCLSILTIC